MKKFLLSLLVLSIAVTAAVRAADVPTWAQSYGFGSYDANGQPRSDGGGSGSDLPTAIAPMPDGGVVVAGQLSPPKLDDAQGRGRRSGALVRYDAKGAIVWEQLLRQNNDAGADVATNRIDRLRTDAAGNIFIGGFKHNSSEQNVTAFVAKFSPAGALLWQNGFAHFASSGFPDSGMVGPDASGKGLSMDLLPDGGVIIGTDISYIMNGNQVVLAPLIAKFNANGSLGFQREYEAPFQASQAIISVCRRPDADGYALLLSRADSGTFVILTDAVGVPVSQRILHASSYGGGSPNFITRSADGNYLLVSILDANNGDGVEVRKLRPNLTPLWQKLVRHFGAGGFALTPTADGGCIIPAQADTLVPDGSHYTTVALLLTLNRSGILTSAHELGGNGGEGATDSSHIGARPAACITTDGALAFTISTFSYATTPGDLADWWTVKSDAGKVDGFADNMLDVPLTNFGEVNSDEAASVAPKTPYGAGTARNVMGMAEPKLLPEDLETEIGINRPTVKNQTSIPIPPPVHGGLSGITFLVNESSEASFVVADSVLRFRAVESGHPAGLTLNVQSSTDNGATWVNLADAAGGRMSFAARQNACILNSTNYPLAAKVYFRAVAKGPGFGEKDSAPVGPFDLTSSKTHLGGPLLFVTTNGENDAIRFGVQQAALPAGISVRIETSETPADEASWKAAPIGSAGQMTQDARDARQFYLGTDDYPSGDGVYFRAHASVSGASNYVDSLSFPYGPFTFVQDPPATVTVSLNGVASPNGNDLDNGLVLGSGPFTVKADASSGHFIKRLTLLYDGVTTGHFDNGATTGSLDYASNIPGDHIVEAYATDDLGVTGAAPPVHVRVLPATPGRVFTMVKTGNWNDPGSWSVAGAAGVPGANDFAIIGSFNPALTTDVVVNAVSLNGGTISGAHTLTVTGFCTIAAGNVRSNLTIRAGANCEFLNDTDIGLTGLLDNAGTIRLHGKGGITGIKTSTGQASSSAEGSVTPDGLFDGFLGALQGVGKFFLDLASGGRRGSTGKPPTPPQAPVSEHRQVQVATVKIAGGGFVAVPAPLVASGAGNLVAQGAGNLVATGAGNLVAQGAGNLVAQGAGNLVAQGAGNLVASGAGNLVAQGAGNLVATGAGNLVAQGAGNLVAQGAGNFHGPSNAVAGSAAAGATDAPFVQSGGETDLTGLTITGAVRLDGGILSGSGLILGNTTNNGGFIAPGHSAGAIGIIGNFAQAAGGTLVMENGGVFADQFDELQVSGQATLGGRLDLKTIDGYVPDVKDTFNPLGYGSVSGTFASVSGNGAVKLNATGMLATVDPTKPQPKSGQPVNISTRLQIQGGDNGLIAGFIVSGPGGSSKKVIIRGLGPSTGVAGAIADPVLELNGTGVHVVNDDWQQGDTSKIPNGFAPSNPKESVIVATLTVGAQGYSSFTAGLRDTQGQVGVGVVEVYDLNADSAAQLANIATRGLVQTGADVLIGGFYVGGNEPATVLVRVTGPSLSNNGVSGALQDPLLELHDANGAVISNDNWRETQESEIAATGIPPSDEREPAILSTLVPGGYTAVVRGVNDTTGVAVIEAYNVSK